MVFQAQGDGKRPEPVEQRPDVAALDVAHGQVEAAARLADVVDRDDVRVPHRGGRPGLAQEPGPERVVAGQFRRQDLERHRPARALVLGHVHSGHAAPADQLVQAVVSDPARRRRLRPGRFRLAVHGLTIRSALAGPLG